MSPLVFILLTLLCSVFAGLFGSLVGLGGGTIVVPVLTLLMGVDIRYAIGASIISVIANSSGAGAAYLKEHLANIRLGMFLEPATTAGALTGAILASHLSGAWLTVGFGVFLILITVLMSRHRHTEIHDAHPPDKLAQKLQLSSSYFDKSLNRQVAYNVTNSPLGLLLSLMAGIMSGLLGVGGGPLKIPAMTLAMRVPLKVASATSNFMIGVTAAATAGVYFSRGQIDPYIAAPVAVGVMLGSILGARIMQRMRNDHLRWVLMAVLLIIGIQMIRKGLA